MKSGMLCKEKTARRILWECPKLAYEPGYSNREIWKMFWPYSLCKLGLDCEREEASIVLALAVRVLVNSEGKRVCARVVLYSEAHG